MKSRQIFNVGEEKFERAMVGFIVEKVYTCVNESGTGVMMELTKKIENVIIGITVIHDPDEVSYEVSNEYIVDILPKEE